VCPGDLHSALTELAELNPRWPQIVELRYLASAHYEPDNQNQKDNSADTASDGGTAPVITTATAEEKQQDKDEQDEIHI
jgi:hypothetical protein